jgi:hypothetical protein
MAVDDDDNDIDGDGATGNEVCWNSKGWVRT